ncbi:hypothetical protein FNU76_17500 [Chitinimonas arctica]|uniref:Phage tail protein n=1 Tax=Chitinimonas arctica TaxID=2594795 RepID=A0A516SIM2_9NEIS|nr:phage tail protein [Chitinimonas arctica]QDQ27996.1 hypothetical protein FNU76_17500 [Chitinimonas arctica]
MSEIPPSSYLRYLPAVFAKADDGFLANYLQIFQKLLTGLDDSQLNQRKGIQELLAAGVVGNLFYSRFSFLFPDNHRDFVPPLSGLPGQQETALLAEFDSYIGVPDQANAMADYLGGVASQGWQADFTAWLNDFLNWLASWLDLLLDNSWSLDKKRTVIAEIMALYRQRGTPQGLSMLLNLLLDLPMQVGCFTVVDGKQVLTKGTLTVNVLNPTPPAIIVNTQASQPNTFVLRYSYGPGMPLVSGYAPWLFLVQLVLPNYGNHSLVLDLQGAQQVQTLMAQLVTLLDTVKPAASQYRIQVLGGMQLLNYPAASQLNVNAVLGSQLS